MREVGERLGVLCRGGRVNELYIDNKALLLTIFTERELYELQLKFYNEVCRQPVNYYTKYNVILEKLGGMPKIEEKAVEDY